MDGHSPHGECGLKFAKPQIDANNKRSLPAWGVWIEILTSEEDLRQTYVTPRMGRVE